jgi:hypothetical protein
MTVSPPNPAVRWDRWLDRVIQLDFGKKLGLAGREQFNVQ